MNTNESLECVKVHVWRQSLANAKRSSLTCLSLRETKIMMRLKSYEDKKRYVQVRAFLKTVLGHYTHLPPEQIDFVPGPNKKPELRSNHSVAPVYFSLSYRNNVALLAVGNTHCIGVDVEEVKPINNFDHFVKDYFSPAEQKQIFSSGKFTHRLSTLFTFWSMKEALVKSLAVGFSHSLKNYDVQPFLEKPAGQLNNQSEVWNIARVPVHEDYKAALAVRSEKISTEYFDFEPLQKN